MAFFLHITIWNACLFLRLRLCTVDHDCNASHTIQVCGPGRVPVRGQGHLFCKLQYETRVFLRLRLCLQIMKYARCAQVPMASIQQITIWNACLFLRLRLCYGIDHRYDVMGYYLLPATTTSYYYYYYYSYDYYSYYYYLYYPYSLKIYITYYPLNPVRGQWRLYCRLQYQMRVLFCDFDFAV